MNLIGKIFTVLIIVMSLVFMGLTMAVYSTHTNWRAVVMNPADQVTADKPLGLVYVLEEQKAKNDELKDQLDRAKETLDIERADKRQVLAKLENENDELKRERDLQEQELGRLKQQVREAVAAMDATQKTLAGLRTDVDTLRTDLEAARTDRRQQFDKVVQLTDDLHQAVNEQKALKERNTQLAADYSKALEVLRKFNLEPDPAVYEGIPDNVEGLVTAVRPGGLLEIDIGKDDGLLPGHKIEVYRLGANANTYLGRIEITDVSADKAVAKVIPEFLKGAIQVGDHVKSSLK
jgi:hypothetical protein